MVIVSTGDFLRPKRSHQEANSTMEGKFVQLFSHADIHIYFIDPKQKGAAKRKSTTIRLVMISFEEAQAPPDLHIPPAFLEAGGWFYPLIPSKTPVYRTEEKYYIFPDLLSTPGASVGIVLPEKLSADERNLFEDILLNLAGLDEFPTGVADQFGNPGRFIIRIDTVYVLTMDGAAVHFETGEPKQSFLENSNYETAKDDTANAVEISGYGIKRLADATSKLTTFTLHYMKPGATSVVDTVHEPNKKEDSAGPTATVDEMDTLGFVYEALHHAGKALAHYISPNHDNGHGAAKPGHVLENGPKESAKSTVN